MISRRSIAERVLVLAHRGASYEAPQNSLRAVRRARELGADGVEVDVQRCAGGEIVVFHDADLRAFGREGAVTSTSLAGIRALDLGGGERVPTLDEVLEETAPDLLVNIELKTERAWRGGLEREVVRCLRAHGAQARVWVSSFNPLALWRVQQRAPELRTALLFHGGQSRAWRESWVRWLRPDAIHPAWRLVDEAMMSWARRRRVRVHPWTCDGEAEMGRLVALRVHGIITNRPERARRVVDGAAPGV